YGSSQEYVKISFTAGSYFKPRNIEVYLNGKIVLYENISAEKDIISSFLQLNQGENIIKFRSREGCDVVSDVENKLDPRCFSFDISNLEILTANDLENRVIYENNWYSLEKNKDSSWRWMSQNGTIQVYKANNAASEISFNIWSFSNQRDLEVYLNNELVSIFKVPPNKEKVSVSMRLKAGENTILFHSKEGCDVPINSENSTDFRCLSFAFADIRVG
ncbi:MAG: hypothetical protein KKB25_02100, partial [Nanoarchaeota archaeon]|nr:hypothetical protein [Nanoarchaeota archaeon]